MKAMLQQARIVLCFALLLSTSFLSGQPKQLKELNVSYPLGGQGALDSVDGGSRLRPRLGRGGKEITFIGAVGNRLEYVLVTVPSVRGAEELKGKRVGVSQLGASPDFIARLGLRQMGLNPEK
jgi:hypothetical protein